MKLIKSILAVAAISAMSVSLAQANSVYLGLGTGVTVNTANGENARNMPINAVAGFGGAINQSFYIGTELNATLTTMDIKNRGIKSSYSYGASVLPGIMLSKSSLVFARAGLVKMRFPDDRATRLGTNFGGGLQTSLAQNIDVRAEYDFISFDDFAEHKNPRSDQAHVDLIYKFE